MTRSSDSLARLTLLGALAATQLTLLSRAELAAFAIMAALSWLGGGLLLLEREEQVELPSLQMLPRRRFLPGLLLLLWALLVLSFSARLYDPLLLLVPLSVLMGLSLLAGAGWRSRLMRELVALAALLPAQVLINRFLPTGFLAHATARLSALLLWLLGRSAFAESDRIVLPEQVMRVDASCTGVNTLSLCLAAALLLALLLPLPRRFGPRALQLGVLAVLSLSVAFLVNAVRVALLGLTSQDPAAAWYGPLTSFAFWHDGIGSHVFSLLAMALVCGLYVLALEIGLRSSLGQRP